MPRTSPDNYDVVVWLLNESAAPFVNSSTSTHSLGSAANLTNTVGTVETGQLSLFVQSCPYFPAFGNYPAGASATHNRLETAGGSGQDLTYPISVSGWFKVRAWLNNGDNYGFLIMKRYRNDTSWNSPYITMDMTVWNSTDGTWRAGVTTAKQTGTTGTVTGAPTPTMTDLNANFTGGLHPITNGDTFIVFNGANAGTYTVQSATTTTITMSGNFPSNQTSMVWSEGVLYNQLLMSPVDFPMTQGIWSHLGWTYDGVTLRAYINGVLAGSLAVSPASFIDMAGHGPWALGAAPEGASNKEEGAFSCCDIRIANTVRPLSYFQNVYREGVLAF